MRKLLTLQIEMHLWRGKIIACFIKISSKYNKFYSLDALMDDEEILFVCWGEGGFRRNKGESGSSGLI